MEPTEVGRRCQACSREVIDLTALTEQQARRLVAGRRACVRMRVGDDGLPLFRREPPRLGPAAAAMVLAACAPHTPEAQQLAPAVEEGREPAPIERPAPVIPEAAPRVTSAPEPCPPKPLKGPKKPTKGERVLMGDPWD
ncbi:hypothetical protein [Nannocystis pusilla]|uniref:hypothetical protein n=1 Tax=Nannocystis pusilla TaxID=889268 RepID=UPI003BF1CC5C